MKGIKKINKILNDFLEPFEAIADYGEEFCCLPISHIINYAFEVPSTFDIDKMFMDYAFSLGLEYNVDVFLLSFLHEVGHIETLDEIDDEEYRLSMETKELLTAESPEDCQIYFNLPDEQLATQFAVDYINEHAEELKIWWDNILQPAIMEVYRMNDIIH